MGDRTCATCKHHGRMWVTARKHGPYLGSRTCGCLRDTDDSYQATLHSLSCRRHSIYPEDCETWEAAECDK